MKSGKKKGTCYRDIKIKTYKIKNGEILYFFSYWSICKVVKLTSSIITIIRQVTKI